MYNLVLDYPPLWIFLGEWGRTLGDDEHASDFEDFEAGAAKDCTTVSIPPTTVFQTQRPTKPLLQQGLFGCTIGQTNTNTNNTESESESESDTNMKLDRNTDTSLMFMCAAINIQVIKGKTFDVPKSSHYAVFDRMQYHRWLEIQALAVNVAYRSGQTSPSGLRLIKPGKHRGLKSTFPEKAYHHEAKQNKKLKAAGKPWEQTKLTTAMIQALSHFVYPASEELFYEGGLEGTLRGGILNECPSFGERNT
ncbi:hypothetical protein C8J57DRAFT_1236214 [Mycena rebaudengoi]|nr:hypothetical protein C8J57DRAFT_1236214 [Mycena rebaudengoi]